MHAIEKAPKQANAQGKQEVDVHSIEWTQEVSYAQE
jgi:hypothetical protein